MTPGTVGRLSGSRLRWRVSAVLCSRSYSVARSRASAHWPASASRKTRSSSVIWRGRVKENRSAPSDAPDDNSGMPTQAFSSVFARNSVRSISPSKCLRSASGLSSNNGRRAWMAAVITLGSPSGMSSGGPPAPFGRPPGLMVRSRSRSVSTMATTDRSAPIADLPTSVMTWTTCSTVIASASIEVACCSLAVRSAAADSCSVSRPRISSASR